MKTKEEYLENAQWELRRRLCMKTIVVLYIILIVCFIAFDIALKYGKFPSIGIYKFIGLGSILIAFIWGGLCLGIEINPEKAQNYADYLKAEDQRKDKLKQQREEIDKAINKAPEI